MAANDDVSRRGDGTIESAVGRACVVAIEVDQKQRYLLESDKLREMLGASRIIAGTVETAEGTLGQVGAVHLPVSGEIQAWAPLEKRDDLLSAAWKIRRELDDLGVAHTCCYFETSLRHFVDDGCGGTAASQVEPSLQRVFAEASRWLRTRKESRPGEDARPACSLFAGCRIHPLDVANHDDEKGGAEEPRRGLVGKRARAKLDRWEREKPEIFRHKLLSPVRERLQVLYASGASPTRAVSFADLAVDDALLTDLSDDLEGTTAGGASGSYVAFLCADGDGMGQLLRAIDWNDPRWNDGRKPWERCRAFALAYDACVERAFVETVADLAVPEPGEGGDRFLERVHASGGKVRIPLLPQLLGGDDLWTVVDRRFALPFALRFAQGFEESARADPALKRAVDLFAPGERLTISIGIAFAKAGHPAHAMTEAAHELLGSAKAFRKGLDPLRGDEARARAGVEGCIDWHWIQSTRAESMAEARSLLAYDDGGATLILTSRPWTVSQSRAFLAAAGRLAREVSRGKAERLETILRLGHGLSLLAWKGWWDALAASERKALLELNGLLPGAWRLAEDRPGVLANPWRELGVVDRKKVFATCFLDLLALRDVDSVGAGGEPSGGDDAHH